MDAFLRVHCVSSWGVDAAIRYGGSVISATLASVATGCGGGFVAMMLLDRETRGSWMDKIVRVYKTRKQ